MRIGNLICSINSLLVPYQNARSHAPWVPTRVYMACSYWWIHSWPSHLNPPWQWTGRWRTNQAIVILHLAPVLDEPGEIFSFKFWLDLWRKWPLGFQAYHKRFVFLQRCRFGECLGTICILHIRVVIPGKSSRMVPCILNFVWFDSLPGLIFSLGSTHR